MDGEEFSGWAKCDCCLADNVFCNSFKSLYKLDGFDKACEKCGAKISKAGNLSGYKRKEDWQFWAAKAEVLNIRANAEKGIFEHKNAIEKAAKSPFYLKWIKFTQGNN